MVDPFVDTLNGYENLAARIKNEDPSLLLETNNTADTPKDVNKNGLMNKQTVKKNNTLNKKYTPSQLNALLFADSIVTIQQNKNT
jgi:hypothetical protein|tara:strand:+ start:805 stop:1059 length:255 start_codon:yes stop_codon:yes gene_type:complete